MSAGGVPGVRHTGTDNPSKDEGPGLAGAHGARGDKAPPGKQRVHKGNRKECYEYLLLVRMTAMQKTHTWKRILPTQDGQSWDQHAGKWNLDDHSLADVMEARFPQSDLLRHLTAKMREMSPPRFLTNKGVSYLHVIRQQIQKRRVMNAKRGAAFHNICGTAPLQACRGMRALLAHGEGGEHWIPFLTRVHSKFGVCTEMYTIQGTASFRVSREDVVVMNFKGVRSVDSFMALLHETLAGAWDHGEEPLPVHVHMAIVALIIGRAVSVAPGCLMMDVLEGMLPRDTLQLACMEEVSPPPVRPEVLPWAIPFLGCVRAARGCQRDGAMIGFTDRPLGRKFHRTISGASTSRSGNGTGSRASSTSTTPGGGS